MGTLEGHLNLVELKEVELAGTAPQKQVLASRQANYQLIVRSGDGANEITRVRVGPDGNYRAQLPPGHYILETPRAASERKHLRPTSQTFTVSENQTVRVDLTVDAGVR